VKHETKKRVMILDDQPFTVQPLAHKLRRRGLEVEITDRPDECLEKARRESFDLFILDIDLGESASREFQDGLDVARALRRDKSTVNVPIVGITATKPEKREEALALGMVKFFLKPMPLRRDVPVILELLASRTRVQEATASWLVEAGGPEWRVLELTVAAGHAQLHSSLVAGEGPVSLRGHDLRLALRLLDHGLFDKELFEEIGVRLYEGLFPSQVSVGLQQCRLLSQLAQEPTRLLLRIEDPSVEHLPWELCRYTGGTHGGHWLGGDPYLTCTRRAANVGPLLPDKTLRPPLRVLVVGASPASQPQLGLQEELAEIYEALKPVQTAGSIAWKLLGPSRMAGSVPTVDGLSEASPANLKEALARFKPDIVHVMAHARPGAMALEENGLTAEWSDFFMQFDFVNKGVSLLFLNCCLSGHPGDGSRGLALSSLTAGVDMVVAHLYKVTDKAACRFASLLYSGLGRGEAIDTAFQEARSGVWSEELAEEHPFVPLLFVRDRFLRLSANGTG